MEHHDDVLFEFLGAGEGLSSLRGTVVIRPAEMILEVELPGDRPFVIIGKAGKGFYEGKHQGLPSDVRFMRNGRVSTTFG